MAGVGVVVPENVSVAGRITSSAVMPGWDKLPVAERLGTVAPAVIDSDVRAAALAEARLGAGRDYGFHVFLTISTGISYCAVFGGRPFAGAHGGALHLGTSVLALLPDGTEVQLERLASGSALVRRYTARGGIATRAEEVLAAAAAGDEAARDVVDSGARALGMGIALLLNVLDPEAVITGGGLGSADTEYWSRARRWARHYAHDHAKPTPVIRGRLGPDAGVIGAAITGLLAANGRAADAARPCQRQRIRHQHNPKKEVIRGGTQTPVPTVGRPQHRRPRGDRRLRERRRKRERRKRRKQFGRSARQDLEGHAERVELGHPR